MKLIELKEIATGMGITPDMARQFGKLSAKATWQAAIDAVRTDWDTAANDDELDEPEPTTSQPTQYGPELVILIPVLLFILTAQLVWRGVLHAWPPVSRWLYREFIGGLASAAILLYRPRLN